MSSPSSTRIVPSSKNVVRNNSTTKRDINPSSSRSRVFGASSVSSSSRHVAGTGGNGAGKSSARVFLDGIDVTPQSLLVSRIKPSSSHDHRANHKGKNKAHRGSRMMGGSVIGASVILSGNYSSNSMDDLSDGDSSSSSNVIQPQKTSNQRDHVKPASNTTKSVAPVPVASSNNNADGDEERNADADNIDFDSKRITSLNQANSSRVITETQTAKVEKRVRRPITIELVETPTEMLFELRSVCVAQDASYHAAVAARNKQYADMCAAKKGSDKFVEGRSQTLQLAQKAKEVMTAPPATRDSACMATDWDIFDCARLDEDSAIDHDENNTMESGTNGTTATSSSSGANNSKTSKGIGTDAENGEAILKQQVVEIVDATMASPGCVLDVDGDIVADLKARQHALQNGRKHKPHGSSYGTNSLNSKSRMINHTNPASQERYSVILNSTTSVNSQDGASGAIGSEDGGNNSTTSASQMNINSSASQVFSHGGDSSDDGGKGTFARANTNVDIGEIIAQQRTAKVLASVSLLKTISVLERAVQQNVYHTQHVLYRNFPSLTQPMGRNEYGYRNDKHEHDWRTSIGMTNENTAQALVPPLSTINSRGMTRNGLDKLWTFKCALTEGRTVTCLAWNTANEDLLAVSYAQTHKRVSDTGTNASNTSTSQDDGLVLFWSLKNPEYPERIYNLDVGVISIDFSTTHPYLLAVGFANGVVSIYDTRKDDLSVLRPDAIKAPSFPAIAQAPQRHVPHAIATSETSSGKHLDAVWQVKWISKGSDRGENVVSISSDGRVTEWSMKKGLSYSDLMTLKRVTNPLLGSDARADGVISRQASGHCLDFAKQDPSVYYVGTEDGIIHKCSVSYNEQYLQTYHGHIGPVYQLLVSPFSPDVFLSCSADWNVKLWHQKEQTDALTFRSVNLQHAVLGISWSPRDATIFGSVTEDGRIEIWDLQTSILDPIVTHYPKKYVTVESPDGDTGSDPKEDMSATNTSTGGIPGVPEVQGGTSVRQEIPLECTKIAFAPSAPVIVVGDSTGDVTVYRVPILATEGRDPHMSVEDQILRLHKAMDPNKHD